MMLDPSQKINELIQRDPRYRFEAYAFVFEALSYAQNVLGYGAAGESEPVAEEFEHEDWEEEEDPQQHVTGQELCEAIRQYALEQYGFMAKVVLNSWGVSKTGHFGDIVFNLIDIGQMRKTPHDRREDFSDVYDFDVVFQKEFEIRPPR